MEEDPTTDWDWIEDYAKKFCVPPRAGATVAFLQRHLVTGHQKPNLTTFTGLSCFVPLAERPAYFEVRALDCQNRIYPPLNERTIKAEECPTLALELDYRYASLQDLPALPELVERHVRPLHHLVTQHYTVGLDTLRLFLFRCYPKPKWNTKSARWEVAVGFHLIWNRRVSVLEGAQISQAARDTLGPQDQKVIDSLYVKGGKLAVGVQLRPALASKLTPCFYCHEASRPTKKARTESCSLCHGYTQVSDHNVYKLAQVWKADGTLDSTALPLTDLLAITSVWGDRNELIPVTVPAHLPRFSLREVAVVSGPQEERKVERQASQKEAGGKVNVRQLLLTFGVPKRHVTMKRVPGVKPFTVLENVPAPLLESITREIRTLCPQYRTATVGAMVWYYDTALCVTVKNATYCLASQSQNHSNRPKIWLVDCGRDAPTIRAGCYSEKCENRFRTVAPQGFHGTLTELFTSIRKFCRPQE